RSRAVCRHVAARRRDRSAVTGRQPKGVGLAGLLRVPARRGRRVRFRDPAADRRRGDRRLRGPAAGLRRPARPRGGRMAGPRAVAARSPRSVDRTAPRGGLGGAGDDFPARRRGVVGEDSAPASYGRPGLAARHRRAGGRPDRRLPRPAPPRRPRRVAGARVRRATPAAGYGRPDDGTTTGPARHARAGYGGCGMRAVAARVTEASVTVDGEVVGEIREPGLLVLLGVHTDDTEENAARMARKLHELRVLRDEQSCATAGAPLLVVSQFTLYGDT